MPDDSTPTNQTSATQQQSDDASGDMAMLSADIETMKKALEEAENKNKEMTEMAKRAIADLQNFKRRSEEERGQLMIFANLALLQNIFPVIDNLNRAVQHLPEALRDNEWVKGVLAIEKQFSEGLKNFGLEEIPCEIGGKFDPHLHEVVSQGEGEKDTIVECLEKGYRFNEKVIRPSKVKVGG